MSFNLSVVLRETAATSPGRTCMVLGERRWTFREVDAAADLVAANLRALGLEPGATIGVQLPNVPQFLFAYYGLVRAGYVMVPMNPLLTAREMAFQLRNSDCRLLVTTDLVAVEALEAARETGDVAVYVVDTGSRGGVDFGVYGVPETFVIDRDGTIVAKIMGASNFPLLASTLDQVLAGSSPGEVVNGPVQREPGG